MPVAEIFVDFTVDCAHALPHVPEGHKCRNVHGHTYRIRIVLEDSLHPELGWVRDFADIKGAFAPIKQTIDHKYLNDIPGLENPTAENLAVWIWNRMLPQLDALKEVCVFETPMSGVAYRGE